MKTINKSILVLIVLLIVLSSLLLVSALPTPKKINNKFIKTLSSPQLEDIESDIKLILPANPNKIVKDLDEYLDLRLTEDEKKDISKKLEKDIYTKYSVIDDTNQFILDLENVTNIKLEKKDIEKIKKKLEELKKTPLINDLIGEEQLILNIAGTSAVSINPDDTAPFLGGSTYVIIVYVNQPGEDWENDWENDLVYMWDEVSSATNWMFSQSPSSSSLSFTQGYYTADITTTPTDFPNPNGYIWMEEAVESIGFSDTDYDGTRIDNMLQAFQDTYNVDNTLIIFVPHMEGRSYAYRGIPKTAIYFYDKCFIFCTKEDYAVVAHEMLHLFGAADEYYQEHDGTGCGANSCWEPVSMSYPPLQSLYPNGNCERCNPNSVDCIMKNHNVIKSNPSAIEYYTKGQIGWWDYDGDTVVDPFDNCIINSNPSQTDTDGDGFGDACDTDYDDDGILNENDNCPFAYNPLQENNDGDSQGDACDSDDDNDGVSDGFDDCPFTPGIDYYSGCPDTFAPSAYSSSISLGDNQPGGVITITAYVYDPSGINYILAEIENPDENVITTLTLYDDGAHGDKNPEDGIYANIWATADEETYLVDFLTEDNAFNSDTFDNSLRFSTETFTSSSKILLIYDDSTDFYTYYQDALTVNNFPFDYYNTYEKGNPYSSLFYNYDLIIWATGNDWTLTLTEGNQINLQNYLDNGGNLFISGQDIGYDIRDSDFYSNYLHAQYIQDDSNLLNLDGVNSDPISDGLSLTIAGEGGADNQWYPSEINPINNAQSIFIYSPVVVASPIFSEKNPSKQKEEYEIRFGKSDRNISEEALYEIISSGTGALKFENEIYKLVYFAFGFEAINNDSVRTELMERIIDWFNIFETNVQITAEFDPETPEAIAGEQVIIKATLTNTGDIETTYTMSVTGTEEWSNLIAIEPLTVTLDAGESENVKIYLDLNEDSEGEKVFTLIVDYDGKTTEQPISILIEDRTPPEITILSPLNNSWYNSDGISINVYTNEISKWIKTSLNSETPQILCSDCNGTMVSEVYGPIEEGFHTFTVYASDYADNIANKTVEFYIDTIKPEISLSAYNLEMGLESNLISPISPAKISFDISEENFVLGILAISDNNFSSSMGGESEEPSISDGEGYLFVSLIQNKTQELIWGAKQYRLSDGDINDIVQIYQLEEGVYEVQGELYNGIDIESVGASARFDSSTLQLINFSVYPEEISNLTFRSKSYKGIELNFSVGDNFKLIEENIPNNKAFWIYLVAMDKAENVDEKKVNLFSSNINIQNLTLTVGNSTELSQDFLGIQEIKFMDNEDPLIFFEWDYDKENLDLSETYIYKQPLDATESFILISGLDLISQDKTKTVYLDKILGGTGICIKDAEITSINEISSTCTGEDETWLACPSSNEGYTCELVNNNTQYKISGLIHSGIKEQETYCGDGIPNGDETCSSCPADVGACPTTDGGGSGGGGGGGGGGGSGGGSYISPTIPNIESDTNQTKEDTNESTSENGGAIITGGVIGALNKNKGFLAIGFVIVVVVLFVIFNKKARTKFGLIKKVVKKKNKI